MEWLYSAVQFQNSILDCDKVESNSSINLILIQFNVLSGLKMNIRYVQGFQGVSISRLKYTSLRFRFPTPH